MAGPRLQDPARNLHGWEGPRRSQGAGGRAGLLIREGERAPQGSLGEGYLRKVERGGDRYYEVTPRGRRRIYPFIVPGYLILFVAVLGLVITAAGLLEQLTGVAPAP